MNVISETFETVLLVGGCGFLGYHTIVDLIRNTNAATALQVHVFDINVDESRPFHCAQLPQSNYHKGDFCDVVRLKEVLHQVRPNVIFDLVSPPMFEHDLRYYMRVNVTARAELLQLARQANVKAYVYNSSAGVVHDSYSDLINADESQPVLYMPHQREPYSHSKAVAESMVLEANVAASNGGSRMLTAAVRLCSPFGDRHAETTNVIVENARAGKQRFQIGRGDNLSDWTYIENGVRAYLLVAQALLRSHDVPNDLRNSERVDGEAFFVTNDEPIPFWQFTRGLGAAAGFPTQPEEIRVIPKSIGFVMAFISEWLTWIMSLGKKRSAFTRHGKILVEETLGFELSEVVAEYLFLHQHLTKRYDHSVARIESLAIQVCLADYVANGNGPPDLQLPIDPYKPWEPRLTQRRVTSAETRVQYMSDLHLELLNSYLDFSIPVEAPSLILAGDIGRFSSFEKLDAFIAHQCANFQRVLFVIGNHEPYGMTRAQCLVKAKAMEQHPKMAGRLDVLHRKRVDLNETSTVLGCTLHSYISDDAKDIVREKVNDFKMIKEWTVHDHNTEHGADVAWLKAELASLAAQESHRNVTVVTHHAPALKGTTDPRYESNPWSSAFSTDLLETVLAWPGASQVHTWVFGHTHWCANFKVGHIRVVSNQRGYVFPNVQDHKSDKGFTVKWRRPETAGNATTFNPLKCISLP
ncbi:MAG: putative secondary metabolism biosynthetic enzyme [Chrysothrix sp. TS-e1954]|nr:MAG: putative secondary metabolism biosynthetic enzyme [Chrysothrix sp. TS-e1954]